MYLQKKEINIMLFKVIQETSDPLCLIMPFTYDFFGLVGFTAFGLSRLKILVEVASPA